MNPAGGAMKVANKGHQAGRRHRASPFAELKYAAARLVEELEGVHPKSGHVAVVERHADVVQQEGEHVQRFGVVAEKVHDAPRLLDVVLGVGLQRVHLRAWTNQVFDKNAL